MMISRLASMTVLASAIFSTMASAGPAASYTADPSQSRLEFAGTQAGAEFKGIFHKFVAAVDFAPDALASSRFDVQIDLNSEDSMDKDRDTTIRGPDTFADGSLRHAQFRQDGRGLLGGRRADIARRHERRAHRFSVHSSRHGRQAGGDRQAQASRFWGRTRRLEEYRRSG
jgi:polyisoprenoid-binding protein YceI